MSDLLGYVARSLEEEEEFHFLRFEQLQRINIVAQQLRLLELKLQFDGTRNASADDLGKLKDSLKDYVTAIRDYQFLRSRKSVARKDTHPRRLMLQAWFQSRFGTGEVFYSHYAYFDETVTTIDHFRRYLMKKLPVYVTYSENERSDRLKEYEDGKEPKDVSPFVDYLARFLIAITGGLFLIVPMLIMAIDTSQKKSLITVSLSVFWFALALSFGVRTSNVEALVSTATYAAVLVVFVGTSSGDGGTVAAAKHVVSPSLEAEVIAGGVVQRNPPGTLDKLKDVGAGRIAAMGAGHLSMQVLVQQSASRLENIEGCRAANDAVRSVIVSMPTRFAGFAVLPMSLPEEAVAELNRSVTTLGFKGAMIWDHLDDGTYYNGARFDPVFAMAQNLDVPLYLHLATPTADIAAKLYVGNYPAAVAGKLGVTWWGGMSM
ncbi:uncharacterized protein J4E79_002999 [Alternaria viburni]|uniref:uncharacterized protein n=1 Tax=Alternaria viburni TaxID=566460 RepID=UPI0020C4344F|nr:uncharacterized protein J4E79_002999 [Alternaria viburni]KAI4664701.1 hypothetical protein J4E79_002999 [Alternaria viburni]